MMLWLRRGILCLLLFLSLVLALLFSHQGNLLVLGVAKHFVPQLEIDLDEGTLLFSPQLSGIAWQDEQVDLLIEQLSYRINWDCLTKAICIDSLVVQGVDVNFHPLPTAEPEPTSSAGLPDTITLPIGLILNGVDISDLAYQQDGLSVNLSQFLFSAQVNQQGATLSPTVNGLTIKMTPSDTTASAVVAGEPKKKSTKKSKQKASFTPLRLPSLKTPLPVFIPALTLTDFVFDQGDKPFLLTRFFSSASWVGHDVKIDKIEITLPELDAAFSGQVSLQDDWPLSLELSTEVLADPFLEGQLVGQKLKLTAQGDTQKITSDLALKGPVALKLSGWVAPLSEHIDHQLALTWKKLKWPLKGDPEWVVSRAEIKSRGNLDKLRLDLSSLLSGQAIPDIDLSARVQGNLKEVSVKKLTAKTLAGDISLTGLLKLADEMMWQGKLSLNNIDTNSLYPDYPAQLNGELSHQFTLQKAHWQLAVDKLDLHGQFMHQPLKVTGKVSGNDRLEWDIQDLAVINGANKISATGKIKQQFDLLLNLNAPSLASSIPDVAGSIHGRIKVAGDLTAPKVNADLVGENLAVGELSMAQLTLKGDVIASEQPSGKLDLSISQLTQPGVDIESVQLTASGSALAHQAQLVVVGSPLATELNIAGRWQQQAWQGQLQQAWFETVEGRWQLDQPGQISYQNGQFGLAKQCWSSEPSLFCILPTKAGASGDAGLVIEHYELSRLQQFLPELMKLTGAINSELSVNWRKGMKPTASMDLTGKAVHLTFLGDDNQTHEIPITTLTLNAQLEETLAKLVLNLDAAQLGNGDLDLTLQPYTDENILQGKLLYQGLNIKAFHYLLPDIDEVEGEFKADVSIDGPLKAPNINGYIRLNDSTFGGGVVPLLMSDLNTEVKLKGTKAKVDGRFMTGDGSAKLLGEFDWSQGLEAWVTLVGDKIEVDYQSQVQLFISPDLKFTLDNQKMDLTGKVFVPKGLIVVKTLPPSAISVSDDVVVIDSGKNGKKAASLPLTMKVGMRLGDHVLIDAFGLKSNLAGQLTVSKKIDGPVLTNGNIRLVDGSYRAFGQNLIINKGVILFSGPPDQPYLSVDAIRDPALIEDSVTAGIKLEGPVSAPEITIYSSPAMDQQNALSYLLRGKAIDSNGGDNSMLTSMLVNLGVGQSAGTVNQIGEAIGVKDLSLDSSGSGDESQLSISGYILPGVQIRYGIGLFTSMTEIALRYEVLPKLYLEAVSGLNNAFDVYYEFDWD